MESRDELKRKLAEAGLDHVAREIVQLARPCYRIERTLTLEGNIPIGASKFGGSPDVPAGFSWPQIEGRKGPEAMEFVGQIRLADLPKPHPEPVPGEGLLSFFTRWSEGRVFYNSEEAVLQRTEGPNPPAPPAPSGFWQRVKTELKRKPEARHTYRACTLRFAHEISPPDGTSSTIKALKLSDAEAETYIELCLETPKGRIQSDTAKHQMFGHADPVQNEMEFECDFLRVGQEVRWDLPQERFIAAARDWVLLLQVDTDDYKEGPGWMWGDAGMVYFWIHRDDLAARAFDRTIAIEQCH
jgi:uncharacterized protein YwqG